MSAPSVVTSRDCHSQVCSASSGTLGPVLQPLPHRCHTLWGPSCKHTQRRTDRPPFPNTPFVLHLSPTQPSLSLAPNLDPWSDAVLRPLACYQVRGSVGPDREPCPVALPWHRRGGAEMLGTVPMVERSASQPRLVQLGPQRFDLQHELLLGKSK